MVKVTGSVWMGDPLGEILVQHGTSCPRCGVGISYPKREMFASGDKVRCCISATQSHSGAGVLGVDRSILGLKFPANGKCGSCGGGTPLSTEGHLLDGEEQLSVRRETCGCVEAQEARAGHPSLEGRGTDRDSGLEFEG